MDPRISKSSLSIILTIPILLTVIQQSSALELSWSDNDQGTSGSDPLGHTWLSTCNVDGNCSFIMNTQTWQGNDWVTDFHISFPTLPQTVTIDSAVFKKEPGFLNPTIDWIPHISGNTVWFQASNPIEDRLNPGNPSGNEFFIRVDISGNSQASSTQPLPFLGKWSMDVGVPVGGKMVPVDFNSVFLAVVQINALWIIPLIISLIGFGFIILKRF